jgi:hypothetical protein
VLGARFDQRRFSYAGQAAGHPLPYASADTYRSLPALVGLMAAQVEQFHTDTGQPIRIVAESEGSVVAETYLAATPGAPVSDLVALSPILDPGRVYYPPNGTEGWGVATGKLLEMLSAVLGKVSPFALSPDAPLLRSLVDDAPYLRDELTCGVPGVRQLVLSPLADAVVAPGPTTLRGDRTVVPAFHGALLTNGAADRMIVLQLAGSRLPHFRPWVWAEGVVEAAASGWQVPALPTALNPRWDGALPHPSCAQARAGVRRWIHPQDSPGLTP